MNDAGGLSTGKRAALSLVLATLIFGRQLASWTSPGNRFLYFWQRGDTLSLMGAILLLGVLLFAVESGVRWSGSPRLRRASRLLFSVAFVQLLAMLFMPSDAERPSTSAAPAAVLVAGVVAAGFWRAEGTVVRATVTAGLLLVPLPLILFLQLLSWRPWRECADGLAPAPRPDARPVFVLLFDEWSLHRSSGANGFLPELTRLRELAQGSFVFENARSPGEISYKAIPRLLFQDPGGISVKNDRPEWTDGEHLQPVTGKPNLFRLARSNDYGTALIGWYLPYAALVGDDLDRCRVYQQEVKRSGVLRVWDFLWANLRYLPDPVSRQAWRTLHSRIFSENWVSLLARIENDALELARESPRNTLAFVHYPLPHSPFIFDGNGAYRGPFPGHRLWGTPEDYALHLRYLDTVLGRFLDALNASGKLDSALVVVTSDHGWQIDPDPEARTRDRLQRVPLLVKWPGQRIGAPVRGEFCLLNLGRLIEEAIGARTPPAEARALLDSLASSTVEPRCE